MMEIYEILHKMQLELKAPKKQYNKFGEYNYRSCEDILEAVKPLLDKYDAILTISDEIVTYGDRYYIKATAELRKGEGYFRTSAYAREAESKPKMDVSQVTGSASSYARKYALNGLFAIDDIKDADTRDNSEQDKPTADNKPLTYETALAYKLNFGKHKGQTLREIFKTDMQYVNWLAEDNKTDDVIKQAISIIKAEIIRQRATK